MSESVNFSYWEPILRPGEKILWEGRPVPGVSNVNLSMFCVSLFIFTVFILSRVQAEHEKLAGAVFLALMASCCVWFIATELVTLLFTRYAFSERRCIIRTDFIKRSTQSYSIEMAKLRKPEIGFLANVYFAEETIISEEGMETIYPIGFVRIRNADDVYRQLHKLQQAFL